MRVAFLQRRERDSGIYLEDLAALGRR